MSTIQTCLTHAARDGLLVLSAHGSYTMIRRPQETETVAYVDHAGHWKLRSGETGHGWYALARHLGLDLADAGRCL